MKIVINPSYHHLADFIGQLPDTFDAEGETIYNGRNVLKRYQVQGVDLVVKSFKVPILVNRFAYTLLRKSKACRSYEYAFEIIRRGCDTPEPVAYIEEYRQNLLYRSYYVSLFDREAETVRPYANGDLPDPDNLFKSLACFTSKLHKAGILHIDYSPGNILFEKKADDTYRFSVIDINRLRFKTLTVDECLRNFDRLCLSVDASTRLAEEYAACRSLDVEATVRAVNEYTDRFFLKRTYQQASKQLMREQGWPSLLFGTLPQYAILRFLRTTLQGGKASGCLFDKETTIYNKYLKEADPRRVLECKYHYNAGASASILCDSEYHQKR